MRWCVKMDMYTDEYDGPFIARYHELPTYYPEVSRREHARYYADVPFVMAWLGLILMRLDALVWRVMDAIVHRYPNTLH